MKAYVWIILVISSAALQIFSLPPYNFWWLGFFFAVPLFIFYLQEERLGRLILGTLIYRFLFALGTVYFIFDPLVFGIPIAVFLLLPLTFFVVRKYLGERLAVFSLPVLWVMFDYLASSSGFFQSFAINSGAILGSSPFLGLAKWGGFVGLGFFVVLVDWLIFLGYYLRRIRPAVPFVFTAVIIFLGWQVSSAILADRSKTYEMLPRSLRVAALSTNPSGTEFDGLRNVELTPEKREELHARLGAFLAPLQEKLMGQQLDLIVLPEALIDIHATNDIDGEALQRFKITNNGSVINAYRMLAKTLGSRVLANVTTVEKGKKYNTNLFFSPQGGIEAVYHKRNLAISGEYWPFGQWRPFYFDWFLKWSGVNRARYGDNVVFHPEYSFSSGEGGTVLLDSFSVASPICLEIHNPWRLKKTSSSASFIANTSSNLWVPDPNQYLAFTMNLRQIEAVWLGKSIIVAGRRDFAGVITPDGVVEAVGFERDLNIFQGEVRF